MKYRHYAPSTKCILVYSEQKEKMIQKINSLAENRDVLIIGREENLPYYTAKDKISMGNSLEEIAHNLFAILREVDSYQKEYVLIEGVETTGMGLAIHNRLLRACEYQYIKC